MSSVVLLPFLMFAVLIPFLFRASLQANEMSELQRLAQQKIALGLAVVCLPLLFLLSFVARLGGPVGLVLMTIIPIPFTIAFLYYHWKYPRGSPNVPTGGLVVVFLVLFVFNVSLGAYVYYIQASAFRNLPERLPPAVPPPVDWTLPALPLPSDGVPTDKNEDTE